MHGGRYGSHRGRGTLFLVGSDAPLTLTMYDRMLKVGSTPVLNAVSLLLMVGSGLLALVSVFERLEPRGKASRPSAGDARLTPWQG